MTNADPVHHIPDLRSLLIVKPSLQSPPQGHGCGISADANALLGTVAKFDSMRPPSGFLSSLFVL